MQTFAGKIAVITGAASGIGRGLAQQCAKEGMSLVLADIDTKALEQLGSMLDDAGVPWLSVPTDVSDAAAVEALAQASYDRFGRVDLLFNNAGVLLTGYSWERPVEDWRWLLDINFMGVLHGVRSFVPRLLEQGGESHIVNTASLAALLSAPLMGPYTVSKMAVRALTETLHFELQGLNPAIGVSLLCPGQVATAIVESGSQRGHSSVVGDDSGNEMLQALLKSGIDAGMPPDQLAGIVFDAIRDSRFWIFPHPEFKAGYRRLVEELLAEKNPVYEILELDSGGGS